MERKASSLLIYMAVLVTSSPRSAQFLRLPDSPRSLLSSDDLHGLGLRRDGEMRLVPQPDSALDSPSFISISAAPYDAMLTPRTPDTGSALPTGMDVDYHPPDLQLQSGLASSVFPRGGDRIYFDASSSLPVSPLSPLHSSQSLSVPSHVLRGHGSPHPLVPSTPLSAGSFSDAPSPRGSHGFAQASAQHLSDWWKPSTSQSTISRLPIGPSSGQKDLSLRVAPPRVRQHHYPRRGLTKLLEQAPVTPTLQCTPPPSDPLSPLVDAYDKNQKSTGAEEIDKPAQAKPCVPRPVNSNVLSVLSHTSSTRTQCDSLAPSLMPESRSVSSEEAVQPMQRQSQAPSHHSYDSTFLSSESSRDVEDSNSDVEGEVQTASRVMDTTAPLMTRFDGAVRPTVVGLATAVVVRSKSMDRRPTDQTAQDHPGLDVITPISSLEPETPASPLPRHSTYTDLPPGRPVAEQTTRLHQHLDAYSPTSGFEPETSAPPSPRHPPSIDSPPSHRTDIPESARSVYFSEDVHHTKHSYLPYDEVVGQGFTFWDVTRATRPDVELSTIPKPRSVMNASSIKSVVSHITAKSKASTFASKVTKISHRSQQSTASARLAWWKRKPLPPPPSEPDNLGGIYDDQPIHKGGSSAILELGQYQRSKVDLGEPQGWRDIHSEKTPGVASGGSDTHESTFSKIAILGIDSLKMARRMPSRRQGTSKKNDALSYTPRNLLPDVQPPHRSFPSFRPLVMNKTRKWFCFTLIGAVILAIILGAVLGTTLKHNHGTVSSGCGGNRAGVRCNLGA